MMPLLASSPPVSFLLAILAPYIAGGTGVLSLISCLALFWKRSTGLTAALLGVVLAATALFLILTVVLCIGDRWGMGGMASLLLLFAAPAVPSFASYRLALYRDRLLQQPEVRGRLRPGLVPWAALCIWVMADAVIKGWFWWSYY